MEKPSYEELQRRVEELEKMVDFKISPQDFYFNTRDLIYFKGYRDWSVEFFDNKIQALTGYSAEDFLNKKIKWLDIVYEPDRQIAQDAVKEALKTDKYYLAEYRVVRKQGDLVWIKIRGFITCDHKGDFLFVRGVLNDTTVEKYGQFTLESEKENFSWTNSLKDGVYVASEEYRIVFMNQALKNLLGDHVGETCYRAFFGRDTVCPWTVMDEVIRDRACAVQEYHLPQLGKIFQVRSVPVQLVDGSQGKMAHMRDITGIKRLELEVQELAARERAIEGAADKAALGIFILQDYDGLEARFRYTNKAFSRITGYDQEELLDMSLGDLLPPESREAVMERYRNRQRGEILDRVYEIQMICKDGRPITVSKSMALSPFEGSEATIGFLRDITEKKIAQKALLRSQRLASIGRIAAEIAHETNNPLTSVLTFSKLINGIIRQEPFPVQRLSELREYIACLHGETERCATISRNLLDFSRQGEIDVKENDIHQILGKTLDILRHRAGMGGIEIHTNYAPEIPHLSCDFKRLQQAFINIFWNAIEVMPEGGRLSVSTAYDQEHDMIEVHISDTGPGIPEETLERIFEPFYTTKPESKGVGLGLSVAYGIVRQHQGEISVRSQPGEGTHFTVQLPAGPRTLPIEEEEEEEERLFQEGY